MVKRLYVGNLPFDLTEDQLHELCSAYGEVTSAKLVIDFNTGESRGFAFIEMSKDEEAWKVLDKMNKSRIGQRQIVVTEARSKSTPADNRAP